MRTIDLICLANSRKLGGRCVAGIRLDGNGWLRPVGANPDGTLFPNDFKLRDGRQLPRLQKAAITLGRAFLRIMTTINPYARNPLAGRLWPTCLDIIRVGLQEPCPSAHQPENWRIDGSRWALLNSSSL